MTASNYAAGDPEKDVFYKGEKLVYDVTWKGIKVGENIIYIKGRAEIGGHKTYHIVSETASKGIAELFFRVRDKEETFIDSETYYPWYYKKDINEGSHHNKGEYIFDGGRETVVTPGGKYSIPSGCHDPLSVLIYCGFLKIEKGEDILLNYVTDKGIRTINGKVLREETVSVPPGRFKTKVVEFKLKSGNPNQLRLSSSTLLWFADKNRSLPVLVKFKTKYGYVKCVLKDYKINE
ncbi:MAG: DUF3108 domain-containing protein [bacterium]